MEIDSPNATGIISGFGMPTGGTSGQLLQKVNATNYNTQWTNLDTPVYFSVVKTASQTINNDSETTIVNWDGSQHLNNYPSSWNNTTGTYTIPVAGIYEISVRLCCNSNTPTGTGKEFAPIVSINSILYAMGGYYTTSTAASATPIVEAKLLIQLAVGDTVKPRLYHNFGVALTTFANRNFFSIQQLPGKILK